MAKCACFDLAAFQGQFPHVHVSWSCPTLGTARISPLQWVKNANWLLLYKWTAWPNIKTEKYYVENVAYWCDTLTQGSASQRLKNIPECGNDCRELQWYRLECRHSGLLSSNTNRKQRSLGISYSVLMAMTQPEATDCVVKGGWTQPISQTLWPLMRLLNHCRRTTPTSRIRNALYATLSARVFVRDQVVRWRANCHGDERRSRWR